MPKSTIDLTLLGFDFGMKRIGVAVGQTLTRTANPVMVLPATDGQPRWETIQSLIDTWHAEALVVGIPYNMDGSQQKTSFAAQRFANRLRERYQCPVYTVDERLTTVEAKRQWRLQNQQKTAKLACELDSYAAKLILEQWLQQDD